MATGTKTYGYKTIRVSMGDAHGPDRCTVKAKGDRKCPCHAEREIIPDEAQVVERIFTMAASGLGNRRIVDILAADHVPAPGKKGWSKRVVRSALNNKLYIGVAAARRSAAGAAACPGRHCTRPGAPPGMR